jgi:hypothetical protein
MAVLPWLPAWDGTSLLLVSTLLSTVLFPSDPLQAAKELPFVGWLQFILGCGAIEWMAEQIKKRPGYVPGDVFGASYWVDDSDEGWVDYQNKELSNGRLAMVAIMGIIGKLCSWMGILSWSLLSYSYRLFLLTFPVQEHPVWKLR